MAKRNLRIVQSDSPVVVGVCEVCDMQFKSSNSNLMDAGFELKAQLNEHTCKREDVNHYAARGGQPKSENERY